MLCSFTWFPSNQFAWINIVAIYLIIDYSFIYKKKSYNVFATNLFALSVSDSVTMTMIENGIFSLMVFTDSVVTDVGEWTTRVCRSNTTFCTCCRSCCSCPLAYPAGIAPAGATCSQSYWLLMAHHTIRATHSYRSHWILECNLIHRNILFGILLYKYSCGGIEGEMPVLNGKIKSYIYFFFYRNLEKFIRNPALKNCHLCRTCLKPIRCFVISGCFLTIEMLDNRGC